MVLHRNMTRYKAILLTCPSINTETSRAVLAHVLVESHGVVSPRGDHRPCWLPGVGVVLQDGVPSSRATWINNVSWMRETSGSFIVIPNMNTLLSTVAARSPYLWDGSWAAPLQLVKSTITSVESNSRSLLPIPPVTKRTCAIKVQIDKWNFLVSIQSTYILTVFIDVSSAGVVRSTHAEMWKELHGPIKRVSCHGTCWSPCVDVSRISITMS